MSKKIKNPEIIFDFENEEDLDICGFSDEPIKGTCVATFSCSNNNYKTEIKEAATEQLNAHNNSTAESVPVNQNDSTSNDQITNTNEITKNVTTATTVDPASKNEFNNPVAIINPNKLSSNDDTLFDNRILPIVNGCAPPIDGEYLDTKRTYMLLYGELFQPSKIELFNPEIACLKSD